MTLVDVVRERAARDPDRLACTFLRGDDVSTERLSYADLDRRARVIASRLRDLNLAGQRALLLFPPGLDFVAALLGCMYASVVAVPMVPPAPGRLVRSLPKLHAVAADCLAQGALTVAALQDVVSQIDESVSGLAGLRWMVVDDSAEFQSEGWSEPTVGPADLAFLQYTSGSTASPKGVMVSHDNLVSNLRMLHTAFGHHADSTIVSWLPLFHDMGLILNLLEAFWVGAHIVLMSPAAFLQRPARWLEAMTKYHARTSGAPNFGYDLCLRRVTPEQRAHLDLSSWEVAYNGAEPVRWGTLEAFSEMFQACGFRPRAWLPCYGLAEVTVFGTGIRTDELPTSVQVQPDALESGRVIPDPKGRRIVSSGRAWLDRQVLIVNPDTRTRAAPGEIGEIWLAGRDVAVGYWNRADETEQTFHNYLANSDAGPFLRTGDLGFWQDDQIFVTGRLKDLIIIAGRNLYPQDIELTVELAHPVIRGGYSAAFSIDDGTAERLVVVAEVERDQPVDVDFSEIVRAIRLMIGEQHDVAVHEVVLIRTGTIPKTSSGKIQRRMCRALWLTGALEIAQPRRAEVRLQEV